MASNNNDLAAPDLPTLEASLARLATAAHILDGFVHRNKNQHRGTQWWGPFDMLRRNVRKILPDLEDAVQRAEVLSTTTLPGATKRRKAEKAGRAAAKQPELDRVVQRAQWVHDVVGAKAFGAFTQVAADRQFAQLGLALIGVLAQVEAAIAPFVKAEPDPDAAGELDETGTASYVDSMKGDAPLALKTLNASPSGGDDMGVAISRDELDDDDAPSREERSLPPPGPSSSRKQERSSVAKLEKVKTEDGASRKRKTAESQRADLKDEKKTKKKKKKKGGDEFDDLFSTLV